MEELVWRKNEERCERSYRPVPKEFIPAQEQKRPAPSEQKRPAPIEHRTPAQEPIPDNGFRQISNKREEANSKINDRYLIGQATQNPFMASNNYINDIEVQMNFLTPQRSNNNL